jgi:very-short-patch-repair endonuclease
VDFGELIASQAGRFTRGQALAAGFSTYRISRRLESGEWRAVRGWVLALASSPASDDAREWEALLSGGPGAMLAGPSAARHLGMQPPVSRPCIVVPPSRHLRLPDVTVLRAAVPDHDILFLDGLLLTCRARAVTDCVFLFAEEQALAFAERSLQRRWISFEELRLRIISATGRRDIAKAVRIMRALGSGAQSDAERTAVRLLSSAQIGGWRCNVAVTDALGIIGQVDIAFSQVNLAIEIDGRAWHVDRDRFQSDRTKQNRLVAAGWTVLRFTWEDVCLNGPSFVRQVRSALMRLAA